MNRTLLLLALTTSLACTTEQKPPASTLEPAPPPVEPKETPAPAKLGAPSMDGSGPLSAYFPFVGIVANRSFANDRGMMTTVESVTVGGKTADQTALLAAIVAHWKGWSAAGTQSNEDVLKTAQAFVEAWDGLVGEERVTSDAAPDRLAALIQKSKGQVYHPPTFEIVEVDGEKLVVTTNWVKGHVGMRGRTWTYEVRAYRVKDGSVYEIKEGSTLPKKAWLSSGPG